MAAADKVVMDQHHSSRMDEGGPVVGVVSKHGRSRSMGSAPPVAPASTRFLSEGAVDSCLQAACTGQNFDFAQIWRRSSILSETTAAASFICIRHYAVEGASYGSERSAVRAQAIADKGLVHLVSIIIHVVVDPFGNQLALVPAAAAHACCLASWMMWSSMVDNSFALEPCTRRCHCGTPPITLRHH